MKLKDVVAHLEKLAPPRYQEDYDNAGLIVGQLDSTITGIITCLDVTEQVLEEALTHRSNLVVAHHPIVFKGLKSITGKNYVERIVLKAIKNDVAIYAIHTNLDNMYHHGVNSKITEKLGLINTSILVPKTVTQKLKIWVNTAHSDAVRQALLKVTENFPNISSLPLFSSLEVEGNSSTNQEALAQIELLYPIHIEQHLLQVLNIMAPHTKLQYDIVKTENSTFTVGAGMIGQLPMPLSEMEFLSFLKTKMQAKIIRHTQLLGKSVQKVAICGGAGSFLLPHAIRQNADVFVTGDYKYHEFFDADQKIIVADIGHYESEQFTSELLSSWILKKFTTFVVRATTVNTNPVQYY
jgi:dinuclear metal center YbgI/SA1388 family protein